MPLDSFFFSFFFFILTTHIFFLSIGLFIFIESIDLFFLFLLAAKKERDGITRKIELYQASSVAAVR